MSDENKPQLAMKKIDAEMHLCNVLNHDLAKYAQQDIEVVCIPRSIHRSLVMNNWGHQKIAAEMAAVEIRARDLPTEVDDLLDINPRDLIDPAWSDTSND